MTHILKRLVADIIDFAAGVTAHADVAANTSKRHTQGTDTTLGTMTANIDMDQHSIHHVSSLTDVQSILAKQDTDLYIALGDAVHKELIIVNYPQTHVIMRLKSTGLVTFSNTVDAGTNKIINVTNPSAAQDAMTKNYADGHYGASGDVAANTAARHTQGTDTLLGTMTGTTDLGNFGLTNVGAIIGTGSIEAPTAANIDMVLGDNAGGCSLVIRDSDTVVVGYIDSDGHVVLTNTLDMNGSSILDVRTIIAQPAQNIFIQLSDAAGAQELTIEDINNVPLFTVISDGSASIYGELDVKTHKIINVVDPTTNQQAATKKYVDDNAGQATYDKIVDAAGGGDSTTIDGALGAAGRIFVKAGTYNAEPANTITVDQANTEIVLDRGVTITAKVVITANYVTISGAGYSSYINGSTIGHAISSTGTYTTLKHFSTATTAGGGATNNALYLTGGLGRIIDVTVRASDWQAVHIAGNNYLVSGVRVLGADKGGIYHDSGVRSTIIKNVIEHTGDQGIFTACNYTIISNNSIFTTGDDGIGLWNTSNSCVVTGNNIKAFTNEGIDDDSVGSTVVNNEINA